MAAIGLERPFPNERLVAVKSCETADVDDPEVERRLARHNPLCQRPTGAAGTGDAEGVKAGTDEEVVELGSAAQDEIPVGGSSRARGSCA